MVRVEGNLIAANYRERRCCEQRPDPSWEGWCGVSDPDRLCTLDRPDICVSTDRPHLTPALCSCWDFDLRIYFTIHLWNGMDHTSIVISACINVDDKLNTCFIMQVIPLCLAALISGSIMRLRLETHPVISSAMLRSSGMEKRILAWFKGLQSRKQFFLISSRSKVVSVAELHFLWHTCDFVAAKKTDWSGHGAHVDGGFRDLERGHEMT